MESAQKDGQRHLIKLSCCSFFASHHWVERPPLNFCKRPSCSQPHVAELRTAHPDLPSLQSSKPWTSALRSCLGRLQTQVRQVKGRTVAMGQRNSLSPTSHLLLRAMTVMREAAVPVQAVVRAAHQNQAAAASNLLQKREFLPKLPPRQKRRQSSQLKRPRLRQSLSLWTHQTLLFRVT